MLNAQEIRWFCRDNLSPRPLLFPLLYLFPTSSLPLPLSLFAPFTSPIFTTLCRFLLPLPPPSSPSTRCSLCWVFVFWVQLFLPTSTVMSLGGSDICGFDVQCGVDSFSLPQSPYNMVGGTEYFHANRPWINILANQRNGRKRDSVTFVLLFIAICLLPSTIWNVGSKCAGYTGFILFIFVPPASLHCTLTKINFYKSCASTKLELNPVKCKAQLIYFLFYACYII